MRRTPPGSGFQPRSREGRRPGVSDLRQAARDSTSKNELVMKVDLCEGRLALRVAVFRLLLSDLSCSHKLWGYVRCHSKPGLLHRLRLKFCIVDICNEWQGCALCTLPCRSSRRGVPTVSETALSRRRRRVKRILFTLLVDECQIRILWQRRPRRPMRRRSRRSVYYRCCCFSTCSRCLGKDAFGDFAVDLIRA